MDITNRPETLEDYLAQLHSGQWFGFQNLNGNEANKTYANLIIHDSSKTKPTEQECTDGLAQLQADYDQAITDLANSKFDQQENGYKSARQEAYGSIADQLDMQYWDAVNGTTTWKDHIAQVKTDNPKPS